MNSILVFAAVFATVFNVRDFGAKGDSVTKDTAAIQAAIDKANAAGGGTVEIDAGTYVSGTIWLKSHVDFHLGAGAVLLGSPDKADYCGLDAYPQNSSSKAESTFGGHFILCVEQEDVTVRGPGVIDGNGPAFLLDPKTGRTWGYDPKVQWKGQECVPYRPGQMLVFCESRRIRIQDLELRNSTYWNCFIHGCEQVQVRGCYIHNEWHKWHTHNGDGIDIDSSRNVTVSDCRISVADDCITLRADGRRLKNPGDCAYVTVVNCTLSTPCNAVRAGVGSGRVHDCTLANIVVHEARTAVNFVSAWSAKQTDGVDFDNIRFMNWAVDCKNLFHLYGGTIEPGLKRTARMRNLHFTGFSGRASAQVGDWGSSIAGCNADCPIEDVKFRDIDVDTVVTVEHTKGVSVADSRLRLMKKSFRCGYYNDAKWHADLGANIEKGFAFLMRPDLKDLPVGKYPIDGENVFAMIQEVDLVPVAERKVEAHRKYIDLQAPLSGEEVYGVATLDGGESAIGGFDEKADIGFYDVPVATRRVKPGEVMIFPPVSAAHAPGCRAADEPPRKIRKAVVKVRRL